MRQRRAFPPPGGSPRETYDAMLLTAVVQWPGRSGVSLLGNSDKEHSRNSRTLRQIVDFSLFRYSVNGSLPGISSVDLRRRLPCGAAHLSRPSVRTLRRLLRSYPRHRPRPDQVVGPVGTIIRCWLCLRRWIEEVTETQIRRIPDASALIDSASEQAAYALQEIGGDRADRADQRARARSTCCVKPQSSAVLGHMSASSRTAGFGCEIPMCQRQIDCPRSAWLTGSSYAPRR